MRRRVRGVVLRVGGGRRGGLRACVGHPSAQWRQRRWAASGPTPTLLLKPCFGRAHAFDLLIAYTTLRSVKDCIWLALPSAASETTARHSRVVELLRAQLLVHFFSRTEHLVLRSGDETVEEFGEFPIGTSSARSRDGTALAPSEPSIALCGPTRTTRAFCRPRSRPPGWSLPLLV